MRTYASSPVKRKSFYRKSELQMFLLIRWTVSVQVVARWNTSEGGDRGGLEMRVASAIFRS